MSEKIYNSTYMVETHVLDFTTGLPPGWVFKTVGEGSTIETRSFDGYYGSHLLSIPQDVGGESSIEGFEISHAKRVEIDVIGLQIYDDVQTSFGLSDNDNKNFIVMNVIQAGNNKGSVEIIQQNGSLANRSHADIHYRNSATLTVDDCDLRLVIDFDKKTSHGHFEYSKGGVVSSNFPTDKLMKLKFRTLSLGDAHSSKIKRIIVKVFT